MAAPSPAEARRPPIATSMTNRRWALAAALLVLVVVGIATAEPVRTSPREVLANADRFDGQVVTISGTITNFREAVSRRGHPYYTFDLSDGKEAVRVFSFGKSPCHSGRVTVDGTFEKVKQQGRYMFRNEITAITVTCR